MPSRYVSVVGLVAILAAHHAFAACKVLPPKLVNYSEAHANGQMIPPAEAGSGVRFEFNIVDSAQTYAAYYDQVERIAQAAAATWTASLDGDAVIEVRVTFDGGDGSYIMAAGPVLVQTGETIGGVTVWQAGTIWEIRGHGDPNGASADAELLIAPQWLDQLYWGYPSAPPANKVDAYDTLLHELGHVLGFIHLEEYYTGSGNLGTTYDLQTRPRVVGHEYAGADTIAAYGAAVPLADTQFAADRSHVGLDDGAGSLMYPYAYPGDRHEVTAIELAILADAGMPVGGACESGDTDGDGTPDCADNCPALANTNQADSDGDGAGDACDVCPLDDGKSADAGLCGCGVADADSDQDGLLDCDDACPFDGNKSTAGLCGCGTADTDTDADGTPNCLDNCPVDANKTVAGACGCGTLDTDSDGDGAANCVDGCPADPAKTSPGATGCGVTSPDDDPTPDGDGGDGSTDGNDNGRDDDFLVLDDAPGCGAGAVGFVLVSFAGLGLIGRRQRRWHA